MKKVEGTADLFGHKGAVLSDDGVYRYVLSRIWDDAKDKVMFIALNPSTADALNDDPTIGRMIGYAKLWGYGGMYVCNLFAYRATDPKDMKSAENPIGNQNDTFIQQYAAKSDKVIFCWGTHGSYLNRDKDMLKLIDNPCCIELSKHGHPKHPLYLKADKMPIKYELSTV